MTLYAEIVPPVSKMLGYADQWLEIAVEHAKKKSFDPAVLLAARLAPDQFPLIKQLQSLADQGKFACARVAGKDPPKHPDTEQTIDEIRARLRVVRDYVLSFAEADFEGAESRVLALPQLRGKAILAPDYARHFVIPNFYFHAGIAYAIPAWK
jgi:uncharacterized protein